MPRAIAACEGGKAIRLKLCVRAPVTPRVSAGNHGRIKAMAAGVLVLWYPEDEFQGFGFVREFAADAGERVARARLGAIARDFVAADRQVAQVSGDSNLHQCFPRTAPL